MQPYFFPHLGYFDLVRRADQWVVFDTPQYSRHGWVARNRILHPVSGWQYVVVPVRKHPLDTAIRDIRINEDTDWRGRITGQLQHYRKTAPFFALVTELVEACLATETGSLAKLNVACLRGTCEYLGLKFEPRLFSAMELDIAPVDGPGDWALRISEALGAEEYVNPPGGRDLFDPAAFEAAGIRLTICDKAAMEYDCPGYDYESSLSVIDVMMWNSPAAIRAYLESQCVR